MRVFVDTNVIIDVLARREPCESALAAHADIIVTRDPDGYVGSKIRVVSPDEFAKSVVSQGL